MKIHKVNYMLRTVKNRQKEQDKINLINEYINNKIQCSDIIRTIPVQSLNLIDEKFRITPLQMAILKQDIKIIKLLLFRGANIQQKDGNGRNCYYYAINTNNPEIVAIISHHDQDKSCYFCVII